MEVHASFFIFILLVCLVSIFAQRYKAVMPITNWYLANAAGTKNDILPHIVTSINDVANRLRFCLDFKHVVGKDERSSTPILMKAVETANRDCYWLIQDDYDLLFLGLAVHHDKNTQRIQQYNIHIKFCPKVGAADVARIHPISLSDLQLAEPLTTAPPGRKPFALTCQLIPRKSMARQFTISKRLHY